MSSAWKTELTRREKKPALCTKCGRPLPATAAHGVCPSCALSLALNLPPDPRSRAAPDRLTPGRHLSHYRLIEKIGRGGMGDVYKAVDERLDRTVAIKILPTSIDNDPERSRRFVKEAKAASALNHPNIVTIHEVARYRNQLYLVMEFVKGQTLGELVGDHGLPASEVLFYAIPIADALSRAHEAGIIHRDLKPQNIMVRDDGLVKLVDFGLAKLIRPGRVDDASSRESPPRLAGPPRPDHSRSTIHLMGTPGYMAPEQIKRTTVDARTDLFAFGAVLYCALSGRDPFCRATAEEALAATLKDPPPLLPDVPAEMANLVARCLRKDPARRFQSATDLQAALRAVGTRSSVANLKRSVAVLPFSYRQPRPGEEHLGDALSGEVLSELVHIKDLSVIGRTSSMKAAAKGADPQAIGNHLGATHLLEGDIRRSGRNLHVSVRLVDTSDGTCEWTGRFDCESARIPTLQHDIADAVGKRLLGRKRTETISTLQQSTNLSAYHAYLLGRHAHDRMRLDRARRHLERAVELDPEYAPAHAALAETWWCLGFSGIVRPRDAFAQGLWAAHRALEIDDHRADTLALAAAFRKELDYNWTEVRRGFERARTTNPDAPLVRLRYATSVLMPFGFLAEACRECESALREDPLSYWIHGWLAVLLQMRRRHEEAVDRCHHVLAKEPSCAICQQEKAIGLLALGYPAEALEAARACAACPPESPLQWGVLGWVCAQTGAVDEAQEILTRLKARRRCAYAPASAIALVQIGLGNLDAAVDALLQAVEERDPIVVSVRYWPPFDPIHDHPRFPEILLGLNFEP